MSSALPKKGRTSVRIGMASVDLRQELFPVVAFIWTSGTPGFETTDLRKSSSELNRNLLRTWFCI